MNKKRTKKFNPKKHSVVVNSAFLAISLSKPISENSKSQLSIGILTALDAFTKGHAEKCHFDTLAATVDLSMMLAKNLFQNAYIDEITEAREGMIRCKDRFINTGKLGFDGEALNSIKFVIQLHDEQLSQVTGAEVLAFMKARANHIRSGNFYRNAEVRQLAA